MQLVGQLADAEQPPDKDGHIDSMTCEWLRGAGRTVMTG
jgi:hypothetical protein